MITVIISSADPECLKQIETNIEKTVGVPYELIAVENSGQKHSLCSVYNQAADRAKHELLCFMHEDIEFLTLNWGAVIIEHFATQNIGLLGVAGSTYKSYTPSMWGADGTHGNPVRITLLQHFKYVKHQPTLYQVNPKGEVLSKVASVDGVWMCIPKYLFKTFRFDEAMLAGFHGYDLDYSLQLYGHHPVYVTHKILIRHYSEGHVGREWVEAMLKVHRKHINILPINYEGLSCHEVLASEKNILRRFLHKLSTMGYSLSFRMSLLRKFRFYRLFTKLEFLKFYHKILFGKLPAPVKNSD